MRKVLKWWATPPRRGWWDPRPPRQWFLQYLVNLALALVVMVLVHAAGLAWGKAAYDFVAALVVIGLVQWVVQRVVYTPEHNHA